MFLIAFSSTVRFRAMNECVCVYCVCTSTRYVSRYTLFLLIILLKIPIFCLFLLNFVHLSLGITQINTTQEKWARKIQIAFCCKSCCIFFLSCALLCAIKFIIISNYNNVYMKIKKKNFFLNRLRFIIV